MCHLFDREKLAGHSSMIVRIWISYKTTRERKVSYALRLFDGLWDFSCFVYNYVAEFLLSRASW